MLYLTVLSLHELAINGLSAFHLSISNGSYESVRRGWPQAEKES